MSIKIGSVTESQARALTEIQLKSTERQTPPAPGSALAVPAETARAEANAAALMTAAMAPTSDGIYVIGRVANKIGGAIKAVASAQNWGSWGFWLVAVIGAMIGTSQPARANHATDNPAICQESYDRTIDVLEIKGGKHLTFSTDELVAIDSPNVDIEGIYLNLVVRGKKNDLKRAELALNGVRAIGKEGKDVVDLIDHFFGRVEHEQHLKKWWEKRYWWFYFKHAFFWNKDSLVLTFDMTRLLVNAQEQFRPFFQRLIHSRGTLTVTVGSKLKIVDAEIRVNAMVDVPCQDGEPSPQPTSTPTPTPTPTATETPVAPTTIIDSATPTLSPTAITTKSFEFSSNQAGVQFFCSLNEGPAELCTSPKSYSGLGNGSHHFKVKAKNAAGLEDQVGADAAWDIDTIAPDVTITTVTPSSSATNSSSITLEFTSNESSSFQCAVDDGAYESCESPMNYTGLGEGQHKVAIIGTDDAGNTSLSPAVYLWTIDQTAPVAQIMQVEPAASATNSDAATFTFAADESASFECSLDGGSFQVCASPYKLAELGEGQHTIAIHAIDVAGNVGAAANYAWTVDQSAPTLSFGSVVPAAGNSNARNVSVEFNADESSTYTCSFDGGAATPCVSPFSAAINTEGSHSVVIVATDLAGNASAPLGVEWNMDFSSPQISFAAMIPSAASFINSSDLTVNITATEPVMYSSTLDGVDLNQSASPVQLTGMAEGQHTLVLTAVDGAGNHANTITHVFTVDLTAPLVHIDSTAVSGNTNQTSNTITFSSNDAAATFECAFNGSGYAPCGSPQSYAGLIEGTHSFSVRAVDPAGNVSAQPAAFSWTVDKTAPRTTITQVTPAGSVISSGSIQVSFASNDADAVFECSFDGGAFSRCSAPFMASGLADGNHTVQVRAIDRAGNVECHPASYAFTVDTTGPSVTLVANVPVLTNHVSAQFTFSSAETATFSCTLDGVTTNGCTSPQTYNDLGEGQHAFTVTARDGLGNLGSASSYTWTIDVTAPVTSLVASQNGNDSSITFNLSSTEANSTFECSLDGATFAPCSATAAYGDLAAGDHVFRARAIDRAGNIDQVGASHSFNVTPPLTTTITGVTPSGAFTSNNNVTFTFASNEPTATFECSMDSGAYVACSSPASYSALSNGQHTFRVRSVLGSTIDTTGASYSWTIDTSLPQATALSVTTTTSSATITWTTNKPTTTMLFWGEGFTVGNTIPEDSVYSTNHSVTLTGLKSATTYSFQLAGHDQVGNFMLSGRRTLTTK